MMLLRKWGPWLRRRGEDVIVALLAIMFLAFIVQIVFRYFFNFPIGWSSELSVLVWLWLVLFGSAFVLKEDEEIRFDLLYGAVGPHARRVMAIIFGLAIVILYGMSFPAAYSYVSFMKVEKASYLHIRFDYLFSIYLFFSAAIIVRYAWNLSFWLRGKDPEAVDITKTSSAL